MSNSSFKTTHFRQLIAPLKCHSAQSVNELRETPAMMKNETKHKMQTRKTKVLLFHFVQLKAEVVWTPTYEKQLPLWWGHVTWHWKMDVCLWLTVQRDVKIGPEWNPSLPLWVCSLMGSKRVSLFMDNDGEGFRRCNQITVDLSRDQIVCARPLVIFNFNMVDYVGRWGRFQQTAGQRQDVGRWCN